MSIVRALQKKQLETSNGAPHARPQNIVPFTENGRLPNQPPEMLSAIDLRIGNPSSAFIGQPESLIGTALPDLDTGKTAGANLNAGNSTLVGARQLPDFVSWTVDAERVEPRLVAITHPQSSYCEEYRSLRTHVSERHRGAGEQGVEERLVPGELRHHRRVETLHCREVGCRGSGAAATRTRPRARVQGSMASV